MRIPIWVVFVLIMFNIILATLLAGNYKQNPILMNTDQKWQAVTQETAMDITTSQTEKYNTSNDTPFEAVNNAANNESPNLKFGTVVATIDSTKVGQLALLPYLNEVVPATQISQIKSFDALPENFLKSAVDSYAVDLLFERLAKEQGITNNVRLQAVINKDRRRNIRAAYLNTIAPTLVNEEQIKEKYDALVASLKDKKEYHARHILLASKKEANIISKALLKKERSFDELAKLFSLDETTGYKGGDLGYQIIGKLNKKFEQAISTLKLNRYSKPFKTELGWHIAIVEDRRKAQIMPYEQAAVTLRENLQQQAIKKLTTNLIKDADIILNPLNNPSR